MTFSELLPWIAGPTGGGALIWLTRTVWRHYVAFRLVEAKVKELQENLATLGERVHHLDVATLRRDEFERNRESIRLQTERILQQTGEILAQLRGRNGRSK